MIAFMRESGVDRVLEIGPGRVLSGLVARIDRAIARASLSTIEGIEEAFAFATAANARAS
jgi:malonyl CoA-acyl carrier protein transacylase